MKRHFVRNLISALLLVSLIAGTAAAASPQSVRQAGRSVSSIGAKQTRAANKVKTKNSKETKSESKKVKKQKSSKPASTKAPSKASSQAVSAAASSEAPAGNKSSSESAAAKSAVASSAAVSAAPVTAAPNAFGDFTGLGPDRLDRITGYREVVIDASEFSKADIAALHLRGEKVYSYLNIGSVETYRSYYQTFAAKTIAPYDGWPDERWMDVSDTAWQDYVVNVLAAGLRAKGVDGFFLDNLDVYSIRQTPAIFDGVSTIIRRLKAAYGLTVIANGGYDFFTDAAAKGVSLRGSVDGVDTESVYTTLRSGNRMAVNSARERGWAVEYLESLRAQGYGIYVIEYTASAAVRAQILSFYQDLPYKVYIAPSPALD